MKPRIVCLLLGCLLTLQLSSCGTLMFQERRGQEAGNMDPNVVVLDGIGLLFFIVPGLVAFAVDFSTGAIYLPPGVEKGEGPFFD
jgi:hypothetical protein